MIRIIHTGDVHLDSPFRGLDPRKSEVRRQELRAAFTSLMTYARTEKADIVLIAGDLFDVGFVTRETLALISSEIQKLSCPVIIAPGNHDPVTEGSVWTKNFLPQNAYVFTNESIDFFDFPEIGVTVYGWAFTSRFMESSPLKGAAAVEAAKSMNPSRINILCGHGDVTSASSRSCPITTDEIRRFGADYTALGHIHNPSPAWDSIGEGIMYCGCLEGRSFDETGIKGAVEVIIEPSNESAYTSDFGIDEMENRPKVTARKLRFSRRRYETKNLDASGAENIADLREKINDYISKSGFDDKTLLRITLTGGVSSSFAPNLPALEEECGKRLFTLKLIDKTLPILDADELRLDPALRGEFYRTLEPMLTSTNPEERDVAAAALRYGLSALAGESLYFGNEPEDDVVYDEIFENGVFGDFASEREAE